MGISDVIVPDSLQRQMGMSTRRLIASIADIKRLIIIDNIK